MEKQQSEKMEDNMYHTPKVKKILRNNNELLQTLPTVQKQRWADKWSLKLVPILMIEQDKSLIGHTYYISLQLDKEE